MFSDVLRSDLEKYFDVIGNSRTAASCWMKLRKFKPDLAMRVGMPILNGLDAARKIKETTPKVKLIFLTMQDDPQLELRLLN